MRHHTKDKGDYGVLKAQLSLFEKGYTILLPQTEHAPFDLVAYKDNKFERVQVKYVSVNVRGILEVPMNSSYANSREIIKKPVDKTLIDLYCVFCPDTDKCYYFRPENVGKHFSLRVITPKTSSGNKSNMADDFLDIPEVIKDKWPSDAADIATP